MRPGRPTPVRLALAIALVCAPLTATARTAGATDYYVNILVIPGTGTSWSSPFRTLQSALAVATNGDRIFVARGTYTGTFTIPAGVSVYGGYSGAPLLLPGRRPMQWATILDAQSAGRVLALGSGSTVDGFTVRNGVAASPGGGGALVQSGSPTIANCIFVANSNTGGRGAALFVTGGATPLVYNTVFTGNTGAGHAVDVFGAGGDYFHIVVDGNTSNGFHIQNAANPVIVNSVFTNNSGRGVCDLSANNQPVVARCLFDGNGISHFHFRGNELMTIAAVNGVSYARDNFGGAPGFVAPAMLDYTPTPTSPLIDAGEITAAPALDLKQRVRPYDQPAIAGPAGARDVGAVEFQGMVLGLIGAPMIGTTVTLGITAPGEPLEVFNIAASLRDGTLQAGPRQLRLGFDALTYLSLLGLPPFRGTIGLLNTTGTSTSTQITIPAVPALRGTTVYTIGLIQRASAPGIIDAVSDPLAFTIV